MSWLMQLEASHYIQIGLAVLGVVIWLVRLEGKVKSNEDANDRTQKDVDTLRVKHESLDSKIVEELGRIRESLARLEGRLSSEDK